MSSYWKAGSALMLMGAIPTVAQGQPTLTLERVFASPDLAGPQPRALKLSPDGSLVTLLKPRADEKERLDLWAIDTQTGQERMLVDSKKTGSGADLSEAEKMQRERDRSVAGSTGIATYDWSPDGKSILVPVDGDLYLAGPDGKVTRLTDTPGGELNGVVSPKSGFVSYVRGGNLFVQPMGGKERQLTQGASDTVSWGVAEFVASRRKWTAVPDIGGRPMTHGSPSPASTKARSALSLAPLSAAKGRRFIPNAIPLPGTSNAIVDLYVMRPGRFGPGEGRSGAGS